ncbi:proline--tRNA ligase [bacterium]|nr:proline--tRNA ligase [candidate division CSSED10-310 bacterium]
MRLSQLFCSTYREDPAEAQTISHKLLLKSGMIRPLGTGIYTYLPLALRSIHKIMAIIREEMNRIDGQEILMPVLNPAELWMETGRYQSIGNELVRFVDRAKRPMVLAMTHEEVVTDLARREIKSHRQLPFMTYQIQTKIRDEPRSRGGLLRVREFHMKDAYSFHADYPSLDAYYPRVYQAYQEIFRRCGLDPVPVEADTGMMGGTGSHEFMALVESGEDTVVRCNQCGYAANSENAMIRPPIVHKDADELPMEEVATPGKESIDDVAAFLGVSPSQTMKAVFYNAEGRLVFVAIRGDIEVNEIKLANTLKTADLALADAALLEKHGIVAGYASPVNLPNDVTIVADRSLEWGNNYVAGANKPGYHVKHVNIPRDVPVNNFVDIGTAREGDACPRCETGILTLARGIELGHIFKLGTKYTDAMNVDYLDDSGERKRVIMGCYGIGIGRLLSTIIEVHHDDKGMIWPRSVAPFDVHLVSLAAGAQEMEAETEKVYGELQAAGLSVLFDDRDESPGVKFNDADLYGLPLRVTLSKRSLKNGGVELKLRSSKDVEIAPLNKAVGFVKAILESTNLV